MSARVPAFDGHNDCLSRLCRGAEDPVAAFAEDGPGHVDLPKARRGGFAGGLFALFAPSPGGAGLSALTSGGYDLPLPKPLAQPAALKTCLDQAAILRALDAAGHLRLCRSAAEVGAAMQSGRIAAVMHMEGAEAIGPGLEELDRFHALGLRSIGPVWSRPNPFGAGVPFRFPADGDTGPGLTGLGRDLVQKAAKLGMLVDLSHITERGFWDVAGMGIPLVATHSNAHALSPSSRNLTDAQLRAIGESGGIVGLNFATAFLRADGAMSPGEALDAMPRHLEHMLRLAGEDHVGLGSDFDGAVVPAEIGDAGGLDALRDALARAGFDPGIVEKVFWRNWLAALERIWGS